MKKGTFGPSDCEQTIDFANNLPSYVAGIARRYGHDIDPEKITARYGGRLTSFNLEEGIAIPGVKGSRREIRRDIKNEIGAFEVVFVPLERSDLPYKQREILEFC